MDNPRSLRSRRDFQRVMSAGHRRRSALGTVVVLVEPGSCEAPRLGLAVPSTVGGAVTRNRIKRRIRAAFAAAAMPPGVQVVVRPGPEAAQMNFQELERCLQEAAA